MGYTQSNIIFIDIIQVIYRANSKGLHKWIEHRSLEKGVLTERE